MKLIRAIYLLPLRFYKLYLSPIMGSGKCRYVPSCSEYMLTSVERFGIIKGTIMGVMRLSRCRNSYLGGMDPVPDEWSWKYLKERYVVFKKRK